MQRREEKKCEHLKMKALEPRERYCMLLKKKVCILVEYLDYKSSHNKGDQGTIYCENIVDCYHNHRPCRYSGISPGYPDPLIPVEEAAKLDEQDELEEEKICGNGEPEGEKSSGNGGMNKVKRLGNGNVNKGKACSNGVI